MTQTQALFAQPEVPTFEPFVDEHVIGQFLQIASRRVLEMARKGQLPAHPIGNLRKTWRFRLSEVNDHFSKESGNQRGATIAMAVPVTQGRKNLE